MALNSEYIRQKIKQGIQAYKSSDRLGAWLHFQAALREDMENITALLWLAYLSRDHEKRIFLLKRVLEIDPENERAKAGLVWALKESGQTDQAQTASTAQAIASTEATTASETTETAVEETAEEEEGETEAAEEEAANPDEGEATAGSLSLSQRLKRSVGTDDLKEKAKKGTIAQRARRRIGPLILLFIVGTLMTGAGIFKLQALNPSVSADIFSSPASTGANTPLSAIAIATLVLEVGVTATATSLLLPTATATATTPPTATPVPPTATPIPLAYQSASPDEKWIEVDLSQQAVVAWEGDRAVMNFTASTGLPNTPTLIGQFRIYQKYQATRMIGPGYNLPNVPFTMYYDRGYSLHGAYWHNNFGHPMSHGCVNLTPEDAEQLFAWAGPTIPEGSWQAAATDDNPGTLVVVHE